ncbi:MAG: fructosamine kinase family protein [Pseudomonadota bacterium]
MNVKWLENLLQSSGYLIQAEPTCLSQDASRSTWKITTNSGLLFAKVSASDKSLVAEKQGLDRIRKSRSVRVPDLLELVTVENASCALFEWLSLDAKTVESAAILGSQLAMMHQTISTFCGLETDNFIGANIQTNRLSDNWPAFFCDYRLKPQFQQAAQNGLATTDYDAGMLLLREIHHFFDGYQPEFSLLHGDLWGGNWGTLITGEPVIFDPASYYGDRETDLAMTELFGGFDGSFYSAYREAWPLDDGYETRRDLYNLYHVLNHFNLFGAGYQGQVSRLIQQLGA